MAQGSWVTPGEQVPSVRIAEFIWVIMYYDLNQFGMINSTWCESIVWHF